ncbi:MAG: PadR family transcriptional regulator [Bacteroidota bacterium]
MQRTYLGEFEELVLLIVAVLKGEAYGVGVMEEFEEQTGRTVNISAIHAALRRLEKKGFVNSEWSKATKQRGGRRKRLFTVTQSGIHALSQVKDTRMKLWGQIPGIAGNVSFS